MTTKILPFGCNLGVSFNQLGMEDKTPTGKYKKGTVAIRDYRGRIQLVWRHEGKRYYLSLGVPYNQKNLAKAEQVATTIQSEMLWGIFDTTLERYNPASSLRVVHNEPSLYSLWNRFVEFKATQCTPNTIQTTYQTWTNHLNKLPQSPLDDTRSVEKYCNDNLSVDGTRRLLIRLNACCEWAVRHRMIKSNPYSGLASSYKAKNDDEWHIKPFTSTERQSILQAIQNNQFLNKHSAFKHSHYYYFIWFLFNTGCRPSEAVALEWRHVTPDKRFIHFEQSVVRTRTGLDLQSGLKTQTQRRFPLSPYFTSVLTEIPQTSSLVFPGHRGNWLDTACLRKNVWVPVLNGLGLEYRKIYQCRHTFISECLSKDVPVTQVAKWVGNSPAVIWKHYAGEVNQILPPEI